MGRSNRSKRSCIIGKGQATPTQVAYIVDRYLYENGFKETRNLFRTEAASLLSNTPLRQARNCAIIPLEDLLNEYLLLKENVVAVENVRMRLNQEKFRADKLVHGMENVMNTYNASYFAPPYPPVAPKSQKNNYRASSSGNTQYTAPIGMPISLLGSKKVDSENCSKRLNTESISGKRKAPEVFVGAPPVPTKPMITTTQEKSIANGNTQYTAPIGMPMSLLGNKKVDSENCSKRLNSESISGKRKAPEVFVGAPPVPTKAMITTTQEKSIANGNTQYTAPITIPMSLLGRVDSENCSKPLNSESISGKRKAPEVFVGAPPVPTKAMITTTQEKSIANGYSQYPRPIGMPVSLVDNKRVDSEDVLTHLNSQFISGKRKGPEFSVGAPPVPIRPRITITQEKSTANEMNKIIQAGHAANNVSSHVPSGTLTMAQNSAPKGLMMTGQGSGVVKCLLNMADSLIPTSSQCFVTLQKPAFSPPESDNFNSIQKEVTPTNCTTGTKERFTISDTDAEKWLEAQAISEDDLWEKIDFSNLDSIDENVLFALGLDLNVDYDRSSPESMAGNIDLNKFMSEYASVVCEGTQEKDMSTQGDDAQDRNKMHNES